MVDGALVDSFRLMHGRGDAKYICDGLPAEVECRLAAGYGTLRMGGRTSKAHRVAYEMSRGTIPERKLILHLCHRRSCIQPAHLYAGTRKQNAEDRLARLTEEGRWAAPARFLGRIRDADVRWPEVSLG